MYSVASAQFKSEDYVKSSESCKLLITFGNTKVKKYRLFGKYAKYYEDFNKIYNKYKISTENAIDDEFFDLTYGLFLIKDYQNSYYLTDFENDTLKEISELYYNKLDTIFIMSKHKADDFIDSFDKLSVDDIRVVSGAFAKELYRNLVNMVENDNNPLIVSNIQITSNSIFTIATGTITNRGYNKVSYVKIKGAFVNGYDKTIDTDWTYAVDSMELAPGESKTWKMSVPKDDSIKKVNIEIIDYRRN